MPSRVIRGEILSSASLSSVSLEAEALFWRMLVAADDYGRLDGRPRVLASVLFPARPVEEGDLVCWLSELENADGGSGPCFTYVSGGRPFVQLCNWERHRANGKRAKTSRFPDPPADPRGSPEESADIHPSDVGRGTLDVGRGTSKRPRKSADAAPPALAPSDFTAPYDPERLVNLLGQEPGTPQAKLEWLHGELPNILLLAEVDAPRDKKIRMAAIRSRVLRHYRQHLRRPQAQQGRAPAAPDSLAERRERAQHLYSVESLLPEPTPEALAAWEQQGSPRDPGWWLDPDDRPVVSA